MSMTKPALQALTADTDAFQAALDRAHQRVFGRPLPDDNLS